MQTIEQRPLRAPGRPRSETSRKAILSAAYRMLKDKGLTAISTPALAAEAGVSTATLYRWWPTKEAIALDAFLEVVETQLPFDPNISSPLERIRDHVRNAVRFLVSENGRAWTRLIMATQEDEELRKSFLNRLYLHRRQTVLLVIDEAIAAGELPYTLNGKMLLDAIYGPLYYRLFIGHEALTEEFAGQIFDAVVTGVSANAKAGKSSR